MSVAPSMSGRVRSNYGWAQRGDINAFFGLMLDNIGVMILMATLLVVVFQMPRHVCSDPDDPGHGGGRAGGRPDLYVHGVSTGPENRPVRRYGHAPGSRHSEHVRHRLSDYRPSLPVGHCNAASMPNLRQAMPGFWAYPCCWLRGSSKFACAPMEWLDPKSRCRVPGLLGSLTAIALVLISFLPLVDIAAEPVAGLVALGLMLATLDGSVASFPGISRGPWCGRGGMSGLLCDALDGLGRGAGAGEAMRHRRVHFGPSCRCRRRVAGLVARSVGEAIHYLPVAIPLALATVVGGIDCTESAAAAGDDYPTGQIIAAEGFATLVGGLFGGVIQSTPYIGHPAYKAMGARSAYTLATAIFVGAAGVFGYFDWIFFLIPKAVIFPILIFVGPGNHGPVVPCHAGSALSGGSVRVRAALAYLALLALKQIMPELGKSFAELQPPTQHWVQTVTVLAGGGGFIVTSLLWGAALAHMIDGRFVRPWLTLLLAAVFSWFGIIHSPLAVESRS